MAKASKRYQAARQAVDRDQQYEIEAAVEIIKNNPAASFDETCEAAFRLGVDPTKSDQMVRGTVALPHGTGKDVRVIVFADGPAAESAREAGAIEVGLQELADKVQGGWTDFDVAVATPEAMKVVRKLGRVLGPRGLMPNPKTGTVTDELESAVKQFRAGRVEYKMDRHGNVMVPFGKVSFAAEALVENFKAVRDAILSSRPAAVRGALIRRCTVSTTMGPGVRVLVREKAA